jgi:CPA2 family monovalent cation:H+ antiporter-2
VILAASSNPDAAFLLLELGGVVLGLAIVARFARRIGLSPIPFYLVGGLAFGTGGFADLGAADEFVEVGAEIGVILMLLLLGLEYSAEELVGNLRRSAPAGGVDLVLNFAPGAALGMILGWDPLAAVMLGGVTYISSSGVVAKLLADLDRVGNRETSTVLTLLVIEDLVMVLYLPIVASLLFGGSALSTVTTVAIAASAAVVLLLVAVRHGERLSSLVFSGSSEVLLLSLLGITLVVAGFAESIQLSAAVGAFLVGVSLSGEAAHAGRALLLPLRNLFAAVFFVFFGLQVDPTLIPDVALVASGLAVVTALTKVMTGWWAARRAGIGRRGRMRAGTALIARGEFSIVIATLGVGLEPDLGALSAAYVVFLAILGPIVSRFSDAIADLPGIRSLGRPPPAPDTAVAASP